MTARIYFKCIAALSAALFIALAVVAGSYLIRNPLKDLRKRARNAWWERHYDDAIPLYSQLLARTGDDWEKANARLLRGECYYYTNKFADALADFGAVVREEPSNPYPHRWIGFIYEQQKALDKALGEYNEWVRLAPEDPDAFAARAYVRLCKHQYEDAIGDYDMALRSGRKNGLWYSNRGLSYLRLQNWPRAKADASTAIANGWKTSTPYMVKGTAEYMLRDYPAAHADFAEAARQKPNDHRVLFCDGFVCMGLRDYTGAVSAFTRAIRLDPKDSRLYLYRARAYEHQQLYAASCDDLKKAVELNPKNASALNDLAWLLATCPDARVRNGRQAVENATQACFLTSWTKSSYIDTLAAAYAELGEFDKAVAYQTKAIQMLAPTKSAEKDSMSHRLALYQAKGPFRQPALESPAAE